MHEETTQLWYLPTSSPSLSIRLFTLLFQFNKICYISTWRQYQRSDAPFTDTSALPLKEVHDCGEYHLIGSFYTLHLYEKTFTNKSLTGDISYRLKTYLHFIFFTRIPDEVSSYMFELLILLISSGWHTVPVTARWILSLLPFKVPLFNQKFTMSHLKGEKPMK